MPISSLGDYPEAHWLDVFDIVSEAVDKAGFEARIVSSADASNLIHKTIVQNLYDDPIVVCDVSGKNPNVMFELGLRLAFDRPTIIIKDNATTYSFDTGVIEHLSYPRDLRFAKIVDFKEKLTEKILATHKEAADNPNYSTFLKQFGKFTVAKLDEKVVTGQEYLVEQLQQIQRTLELMNRPVPPPTIEASRPIPVRLGFPVEDLEPAQISEFQNFATGLKGFIGHHTSLKNGRLHTEVELIGADGEARKMLINFFEQLRRQTSKQRTAAS